MILHLSVLLLKSRYKMYMLSCIVLLWLTGYRGTDCSELCPSGTFGEDCAQRCNCKNGAKCSTENGRCNCTSGEL
jgi:hypothetical protein